MSRACLAGLALMLVAGCTAPPPRGAETPPAKAAPPASEVPPLATAPAPASAPEPVAVPTREFLLHGMPVPSRYRVAGFLLFAARPTDGATRARYRAVCEAFLARLPSGAAVSKTPGIEPIPTFWLLASPVPDMRCETLVAHYDYDRATEYLSKARKLAANGPLLVAWNQRPQAPRDQLLVLDASRVGDDGMGNVLNAWRSEICQDPARWKSGFRLTVVRQALRNLLQTYGNSIVQLLDVAHREA